MNEGSWIGATLGHYQILDLIGRGGMAEVYLGLNTHTDDEVAIKFMHAFLARDEGQIRRFVREAEALSQLDHEHIIHVFEFAQADNETYYLVLEYIDGTSLREHLDLLLRLDESMKPEQSLDVFNQVADALAYAHGRGLIHRDVKSDNIMLDVNGRAVLTDFGLVKHLDDQQSSALTLTGTIMGTPAYMPPEQAMGNPGDERADIYSLGVVLYEMLTGRLPFVGDSMISVLMQVMTDPPPLPSFLNRSIPPVLESVVLKALAKDPVDRFQTVPDLVTALGMALSPQAAAKQAPTDSAAVSAGPILADTVVAKTPFQAPPRVAYFTGRQAELADIERLLEDGEQRVVGLLGAGGVGKTAVAIQTAHLLRHRFADGVLWAQLDGNDPENELLNFAAAFGQSEELARLSDLSSKSRFVRDLLADKELLLILDQASDNRIVEWLLPSGERNHTLITTRNGKMLAQLGGEAVRVGAFSEVESLTYLQQMLGEARIMAEATAAQHVIKQLGGHPLALSIVVGTLAGSHDLTFYDYADLLDDEQKRLELLADLGDDTRDIAASFELSYRELQPRLQEMFRSLGIFEGPDFDSHAVAAISGTSASRAKMGLNRLFLMSLLTAGLGRRDGYFPIAADGNGRYRLNPLLKSFARRKLASEMGTLNERALTYYVTLAEENQQVDNFAVLDLEWQNVVHFLELAADAAGERYARGVLALTHWQMGVLGFLGMRGLWAQARQLLESATGVADLPAAVRLDLVIRLAILTARQSDFDSAVTYRVQAEDLLADKADLNTPQRQALLGLLRYLLAQQASGQVRLHYLNASLLALASDDSENGRHERGYLLTRVADTQYRLGQFRDAARNAETALTLLPDKPTSAQTNALNLLGLASRDLGDLAGADRYLQAALAGAKSLGDIRLLANLWMNKGALEEMQGNLAESAASQEHALNLIRFMGNVAQESGCLINLGVLYLKLDKIEIARNDLTLALQKAEAYHALEWEALASWYLAQVQLLDGAPEAAGALIARTETLTEQLDLGYLQPALHYLQSELALAQGDIATAVKQADAAIAAARGMQYRSEEGIAWRFKGNALTHTTDQAAARQAYETSLTLLADQDPYETALTQVALVENLGNGNVVDDKTAKQHIKGAIAIFADLGIQSRLADAQQLAVTLYGSINVISG